MRELTIKGIIGSNLKLGENPHICLPKITIEVLKYYQELMKAYETKEIGEFILQYVLSPFKS